MEPILRMKEGLFRYGEKTLFRDLEFRAAQGEMVCILGANGCGKTTLLRCLSGALRLERGNVLLEGKDSRSLSPVQVARRIGIVFQEHSAPFPYSVLEVVRMGRAPHLGLFSRPSGRDTRIAQGALEAVGMDHLRDKPYTRISGGERQLVLIARTLAQEPDVILLDEPTSHLDLRNQARVLGIIRRLAEGGMSVVMSTHLPNHALLLRGRVMLMHRGGFLASGDPERVITEANLEEIYGIGVRILEVDEDCGAGRMRLCIPSIPDEPAGVFPAPKETRDAGR
ncbi:MAG: ABC transporter ATP-binding protein [Deltaproteobacteria bacterium]|nr:ABC transporter ATP-binding protein [Deltaproteobacteria bacterium]